MVTATEPEIGAGSCEGRGAKGRGPFSSMIVPCGAWSLKTGASCEGEGRGRSQGALWGMVSAGARAKGRSAFSSVLGS